MTAAAIPASARRLVNRFRDIRLAVAGDLIADEFIYGRLDRVSREAPVLILRYDSSEIVPGGAGNAACNAHALGARVALASIVGRDEAGRRLLAALPAGMSRNGIIRAHGHVTPVKTRILAGGVHSAKQQVVRIDRAGGDPGPAAVRQFEHALAKVLRRAHAVIVSDYGSGLVTPDRWNQALTAARRRSRPLVFIDSRYHLDRFEGMTACTPNESEVEALLGIQINDDKRVLEEAGHELLARLQCRAVLITRGGRGMALFEPGKPTDHIPIVGSDEIADVTGAGDTVIATFALAVAAGGTFADAARLANRAGGIVVMKRGTATVSAQELLAPTSPRRSRA